MPISRQLGDRRGVRVIFRDRGPGIPDIQQALTDGFTSGNGLGHGLGGARRLVDDFDIQSTVGAGTTVTIARWSDEPPAARSGHEPCERRPARSGKRGATLWFSEQDIGRAALVALEMARTVARHGGRGHLLLAR